MKKRKNTSKEAKNNKFGFGLFIIILIYISLAQANALSHKIYKINIAPSAINYLFMPDSAIVDSSYSELVFGDTLETIIDGGDTIYVLYDGGLDSNTIENRTINTGDIIISLRDEKLAVNHGVYGVNLEGFFGHYNDAEQSGDYEDVGATNPWDLLADLSPKVLRSPSGASSKFQHPFGSMNSNSTDLPVLKMGKKNGGYGYSIEEIIRYYDKTDGVMDVPEIITLLQIITDMADEEVDPLNLWMDAADKEDFESFYKKWLEQPAFEPGDFTVDGIEQIWNEPLYINDFIDMIQYIEEREEYTIDVICTINILSEPALKVAEMIDYLRDETLNDTYAVNIVGVELGNECYFKFYERAMGFGCYFPNSAFDHYWAYINGTKSYDNYFGVVGDFALADVLDAETMLGMDPGGYNKHDYVGILRDNSKYDDIKIGIPVETPEEEGSYHILPGGGDGGTEEEPEVEICPETWNAGVVSKYGATSFEDKDYDRFIFDAVVPHLYFAAQNKAIPALNTNWGEIPIGGYTPTGGTYIPNCLDGNLATGDHDNFTTGEYIHIL